MARPGKTISTKFWSGVANSAVNSLTTTQTALNFVSISEGTPRLTLLRSRGSVFLSAAPDAATDVEVVGLGLIVVHGNAVTAGGASLPGPISDVGADWLWHTFVPMDAIIATASVGDNMGLNVRVEIDSKAMRRVPPDHCVALMAERGSTAFASVTALSAIRLLFGH